MKRIGIILRPDLSPSGYNIYLAYQNISDIIINLGAIPLGIFPPTSYPFYGKKINDTKPLTINEIKTLHESLSSCDGIIMQGGDDFYYHDLEAITYFYELNKPILGICLGMQTMAYFLGGKEEKINDLSHSSKENYVHKVILKRNSLIYNILKKDTILVNSRHKYHFTDIDNKYITGISDDNIIEVIEDNTKEFFLGVQWHPESMINYDPLMLKIFERFIEKVKKKEF